MKKATITFLFSVAFCTFMLTKTKCMGTNITEIWKDVVGYEGIYRVSNTGRVWSNERPGGGNRFIRQKYHKKGYKEYTLCRENNMRKFKAHRLVAIAFIPNPLNLPQVNHKNGIKDDNRVENLEWISNIDNTRHSWRELGRKPAEDTGKKPVYQLSLDGFFIAEYSSGNEAQRVTGFKHIHDVCRGERNHAGGYRWSY